MPLEVQEHTVSHLKALKCGKFHFLLLNPFILTSSWQFLTKAMIVTLKNEENDRTVTCEYCNMEVLCSDIEYHIQQKHRADTDSDISDLELDITIVQKETGTNSQSQQELVLEPAAQSEELPTEIDRVIELSGGY